LEEISYFLTIEDNSTEKLERFIKRIKSLDPVKNVSSKDSKCNIVASNAESLIPVIFSIAFEIDINITSITMKKPSLDDVYLAYTGREFRDEDGSREDSMRMRRLLRRTR